MKEEESDLEKVKEEYAKIQKKYGLPSFEKMNEDFYVERAEGHEFDLWIREFRKYMGDKFANYLRLTEALLNPSNAPMFIFAIVKSLNQDDKAKLSVLYKKLAKIEVELIKLDIDFSEENEVNFIKRNFKEWQEMKKEFKDILKIIDDNWDNKFEVNKKGYFG